MRQIKLADLIADIFKPEQILCKAERSLQSQPVHLTDCLAPLSPGRPNDYYSNGDYWWPNPDTPDGLPYINRDGQTNPFNFNNHRLILRKLRNDVANLSTAYVISHQEKFAARAIQMLTEFFLEPETRMNPHLLYAQAIPGRCSGRGIGIIDTIHLIDIPVAVMALNDSGAMTPEIYSGLRQWFQEYLTWISTHPYGLEEQNARNNHGVCWLVQASVFARFIGDVGKLNCFRQRYKEIILPGQMALDGSFPRELERTKPYGYSIFTLDNMLTLCQVLSSPEENLWDFALEDGRGIKKGLEFLYPYLIDKAVWPYPPDVQHFQGWPTRFAGLIFAGVGLKEPKYIHLWNRLSADPDDPEILRNLAIRQPILWLLDNW